MPELPEVETVVRGLALRLPGRRIVGVRLGKTDFIDDPAALETLLPGSRITAVRRHGKYLVVDLALANGTGAASSLLIHLGMTGQLTTRPADEPVAPHTHAFFALDDGTELRYRDIRRFGRLLLAQESSRNTLLGRLGLDPLETSRDEFCAAIAARRARVKALLLDQHVFRGLGNIYTDESLWRARIHPIRLGASLRREELVRLFHAVQSVLRLAIRWRGSSISDFVDSEGAPGEFQVRHRVHQREGKPCSRCGGKILRVNVAGRSSYFCPRCQPEPRLASKPSRSKRAQKANKPHRQR